MILSVHKNFDSEALFFRTSFLGAIISKVQF